MFAKLDNFGPSNFFFTLSCADLRWDKNFAAILKDKGLIVRYAIEEDDDGFPSTTIFVDYKKNDKYTPKESETILKMRLMNLYMSA